MGKRAAERKWTRTPVKLYNPDFGEFSGVSQDISDTGVFIEMPPCIGLETEHEQKLVFPNSVNSRVIFNVCFVRSTELGSAFQFVGFETAGIRYPMSDLRNLWNIHKSARMAVAR